MLLWKNKARTGNREFEGWVKSNLNRLIREDLTKKVVLSKNLKLVRQWTMWSFGGRDHQAGETVWASLCSPTCQSSLPWQLYLIQRWSQEYLPPPMLSFNMTLALLPSSRMRTGLRLCQKWSYVTSEVEPENTVKFLHGFLETLTLGSQPPYCEEALPATWRDHRYVFWLTAPAEVPANSHRVISNWSPRHHGVKTRHPCCALFNSWPI